MNPDQQASDTSLDETEQINGSQVTIDATTEINKMPAIQARVSAWVYMQDTEAISKVLEELHMIILDDVFENQRRLQNNLIGLYNPNDFNLARN